MGLQVYCRQLLGHTGYHASVACPASTRLILQCGYLAVTLQGLIYQKPIAIVKLQKPDYSDAQLGHLQARISMTAMT